MRSVTSYLTGSVLVSGMTAANKHTNVQITPGQIQKTCLQCTRQFWCYPSKIGKYCGPRCRQVGSGAAGALKRIQERHDPQACKKCKKEFPLADYPIRSGRPALRCKDCVQATPEQKRRRHLWNNFKITLEDWTAMYSAQGGACPICQRLLPDLQTLCQTANSRTDSWSERNWNTDHCHTSGKVRGILCRYCNMGLGSFKEDQSAMLRAIEYLKTHAPV